MEYIPGVPGNPFNQTVTVRTRNDCPSTLDIPAHPFQAPLKKTTSTENETVKFTNFLLVSLLTLLIMVVTRDDNLEDIPNCPLQFKSLLTALQEEVIGYVCQVISQISHELNINEQTLIFKDYTG